MTVDILLTNDDGIHAPGLKALADAFAVLGTVHVVAPDSERSAFGHAITTAHPLRAAETRIGQKFSGIAVSGTPADCVKLAVNTLLPNRPSLVVAGINPGPNTGTNVLYSGTVSAAREATIFGIPALAVSLRKYDPAEKDFAVSGEIARHWAEMILERGLPAGVLLNLNIPAGTREGMKGTRLTRLARYRYHDRYDIRKDPRGRNYYWLTGEDAEVLSPAPDMDAVALDNGYVSVTPLSYDLTCEGFLTELKAWEKFV